MRLVICSLPWLSCILLNNWIYTAIKAAGMRRVVWGAAVERVCVDKTELNVINHVWGERDRWMDQHIARTATRARSCGNPSLNWKSHWKRDHLIEIIKIYINRFKKIWFYTQCRCSVSPSASNILLDLFCCWVWKVINGLRIKNRERKNVERGWKIYIRCGGRCFYEREIHISAVFLSFLFSSRLKKGYFLSTTIQ